jgi:dienelactone hydrolase/Fe-S cluster assembly iron-binding protein IscA
MTRSQAIAVQLLSLVIVTCVNIPGGLAQPASPTRDTGSHQGLLEARKDFVTQIVRDLSEDREAVPQNTPSPWQLIHYTSPIGQIAAYLTSDPKDGKKHPAMVWAHGGFGGIGPGALEKMPDDNDQSPHAFLEAGCVVMYPSWRGTNDNPGKPEYFYGEVDDIVAAIQYVASLSYVDRSRIYLGGHSVGGTLALLAAEESTDVRAAFCFGPMADLAPVAGPGGMKVPFDRNRPGEIEKRSAIHYAAALKTPTFCIEGSRSPNWRNFAQLEAAAAGAPLHTYVIHHGDHFNILHSMTAVLAAKVAADTGSACNIAIDQKELDDAFNGFLDAQIKARRDPIVTVSPAAAARIAKVRAANGDKEIFLRLDVTADDDVSMRPELAARPTDIIMTSEGVKVALSVEANRLLPPMIIDFDPASHELNMRFAKKGD